MIRRWLVIERITTPVEGGHMVTTTLPVAQFFTGWGARRAAQSLRDNLPRRLLAAVTYQAIRHTELPEPFPLKETP